MAHAYFCAKVKNYLTDPRKAIKEAKRRGLRLWWPAIEVKQHSYPNGAMECKKAIDDASLVICQPPIGRDCAWELGYAIGKGKKIVVLGRLHKEDWMTKIGVKYA